MTTKEELIGKKVLVGLTFLDAAGNIRSQQQLSGVVKAIHERIELELDDGNAYFLPSDPSAFYPATPGEYKLKGDGKIVTDPEYLCTYDITAPHDH